MRRAGSLALLAASVVAAALASTAAGATVVCAPGSGAGQCSDPGGVATDFETGRVYVADRGNNRVDVFAVNGGSEVEFLEAWGWDVIPGGGTGFERCTVLTGCKAGTAGSGVGQFNDPRRIAVDNDLGSFGSTGHHAIYVFSGGDKRLQKLKPDGEAVKAVGGFADAGNLIAVGPGGLVYVGDTLGGESEPRIKTYNPDLEALGECEPSHDDRLNGGLAVDSGGEIYAKFNKSRAIRKFEWEEPACPEVKTPPYPLEPESGTFALAFDDDDDLYARQGSPRVNGGSFGVIARYDPAGTLLRRYGFGEIATITPGIAPLASAGGDIFAAEQGSAGAVKYLTEPPPGPVIASLQADTANVKATLEAEINPEGEASEYRFEYVDQESFDNEGGFASPNTKEAEGTLDAGAADFALHLASEPVGCEDPVGEAAECLIPETTYVYRVFATNAAGEGNSPVQGSFETKEALEITEVFASEVGPDSARFSARVNTLGIPATGYFEVEAQGSGEPLRVPGEGSLDFGSGEEALRSAATGALVPGTEYRLRFKATNLILEAKEAERTGEEEPLFRTPAEEEAEVCPQNQAYRTGVGAYLPDCRAYELVTPLDKAGGDIANLEEQLYLLPAVLNQSSLSGDRLAYGTYRAFGDAKSAPYTAQYIAARGPGEWSSHFILGPREELNVEVKTSMEGELKALSGDLCEGWFKAVAEPQLAAGAVEGEGNLYRRSDQECGEESYEAVTRAAPKPEAGNLNKTELQGVSADGGKAVYATRAQLTSDAPDKSEFYLYFQEEGEGQPRYVCRGTDGLAIAASCSAGGPLTDVTGQGRSTSLHNAFSADGERVFFTTPLSGAGAGKIFLRQHPGKAQSSSPGDCMEEESRACTIAVSKEAEGLEGSSGAQYWWAAADGSRAIFTTGGTLYEFEVEGETTSEIAAGAIGVMGASEDAERVYFASTLDLGAGPNPLGESAEAGKPNLYLAEGGAVAAFVGTLSASDVGSDYAAIAREPQRRTARVTADGLHAAFTSTAKLTPYDNTDAHSGEADQEVYLYDATGEGELVCASCNPSGARPVGSLLPKGGEDRIRAAGTLPVWFKALYPGRLLSPEGTRLFFEAADALVPRDSNGATDVYQWEEVGTGGCDQADAEYSAQNGGCVSLVSSGQSAGAAAIADASPSGDDVFFTTAASLVGWDYGLIDIYDARVDGGLDGPPTPPAECEGESCQNPAPAPQATPPASLQYEGPGNLLQRARANGCARPARRARRLADRARRLRRAVRRAKVPATRRKRARSARRSAREARRLSRQARRCRVRARGRAR